MKASSANTRLFIDHPLQSGAIITLNKAQSHYLCTVMRKKQGAELSVFNGKDGQWQAKIEIADKKKTSLSLQMQQRIQMVEPDFRLYFAPIKQGRIDFLVQKATELGASALIPIKTDRCNVTRVNVERISANIVEAAEQSERLTLPTIEPLQTFNQAMGKIAKEQQIVMADETGGGRPPHLAFADLSDVKNPSLNLFIGPEGGFTEREIYQLTARKTLIKLSLGPRILRADTAALAALTACQIFCGDWPTGTPHFQYSEKVKP